MVIWLLAFLQKKCRPAQFNVQIEEQIFTVYLNAKTKLKGFYAK